MTLIPPMEIKLAAFILGGLEVLWGLSAAFHDYARVSLTLGLYNLREEFSLAFVLAGLMVITGSVFPCRQLRHWGLVITVFVNMGLFAFLSVNGVWGIAVLSLPWVAVMAMVVLLRETIRKPRCEKVDR